MQHRPRLVENHNSSANQLRVSRRISTSDPSNSSATDFEETISDLDSVHDTTISPSQSDQSSRPTSPSDPPVTLRKSKTSGLRLSLKSLRSSRLSFHFPTDSEHSPDLLSVRRSMDGARISQGYRASLELPNDERTSFESMDPRHRDQPLSPSQISMSAPKASRLSFIHSPAPSTPTVTRPLHHRSYTTPTDSTHPSSFTTSTRRGSPQPKSVKETHTMTKEYDPTTGIKMINKYMVVQELGRGVHGKVKLCCDTMTDKPYVSPSNGKPSSEKGWKGQGHSPWGRDKQRQETCEIPEQNGGLYLLAFCCARTSANDLPSPWVLLPPFFF